MFPLLRRRLFSSAFLSYLILLTFIATRISIPCALAVDEDPREIIHVAGYPVTIEYYPEQQKVADKVNDICERSISKLASELGVRDVTPFRILLIGNMPEYRQKLNVRLPEWGVAFAFMENQVMLVDVKKATARMNTLDKVVPHELSHLLLAQRVGDVRMPLWFVEGLAVWQAREWSIIDNWQLMEAVWGKRAMGLWELSHSLPAQESLARDAYRVAYAGLMYRFDKEPDRLPDFLAEIVRFGDFTRAFREFWSEDEFAFYDRYASHLNHKYSSRLMFFQTGPLFSVVAVAFVFVIVWIQIRNRRRLKRMERTDQGLSIEDR